MSEAESAACTASIPAWAARGSVREQTEQWEQQRLSGYAALAARSRGREREEPECVIRTCFQRDRDRIIHCKAFRRLTYKTQVFIAPERDHYRTRLTHTLEVAQIARTIARALRLNEDLTEATALGHDLGHTPFGHAGEWALDEVYREYVPEEGFRHAEQSLRVVQRLERGGVGLNLCWEVRDGIAHHSKGREDFPTEAEGGPATLEGQVVLFADRIAYVSHDVDDAIRGGLIRAEDLPARSRRELGEGHSARINTMVSDVVASSLDSPQIAMGQRVLEATHELKDFLFARVYPAASTSPQELRKVREVLGSLFRLYMEQPELLGAGARPEGGDMRARARVVCDHVAGMTDRYARECFAEFFLPSGWSV